MSQLPESHSSPTEDQQRRTFVMIIPCAVTKDSLDTLRRVIWGLDAALQVTMLFEADAEASPIAVVEYTSSEQGKDVGIRCFSLCSESAFIAEIAVSQLNNRLSRFIFAGFPRVLKSLPKDCTDFMLHNLLRSFGIDIVATRVHNKLEGISLFRTEVAARTIQIQASLAQIQLHEVDFSMYLTSVCILFSDPYSASLICRTGEKRELKSATRYPRAHSTLGLQ